MKLLSTLKNALKNSWLLFAFAIVVLILWNTNILFKSLSFQERTKMELWATAQQELIENSDLSRDYGILAFDVLQKIGVTPMIKVNASGHIKDFKNIAWEVQRDPDSLKLYALLQELKLENEPIAIRYKDVVNQTLYYDIEEGVPCRPRPRRTQHTRPSRLL